MSRYCSQSKNSSVTEGTRTRRNYTMHQNRINWCHDDYCNNRLVHYAVSTTLYVTGRSIRSAAAAVVFCPTGRFTFSIDTILSALVPAPWVVNNPCPRHLSPVASSVAFLSVFLFPSSLVVDLPTLFSPKYHDVTRPNHSFAMSMSHFHTTLYSTQMLWLCVFFSWRLRDPHMRSFYLLKASFANAMWRLQVQVQV